jgi:zinc transport system substrate-binding protein
MRHYLTNKTAAWLALAPMAASALFVAACSATTPVPRAPERQMRIVVTIYPLQYFAQRIAGAQADVRALVPSGAEAHGFAPTAGDIVALAEADLVVANGLGLEPWLERALDALESPPPLVEASTSGSTRLGELDPHVWLDPLLAMGQAERIADALVSVDPTRSTQIEANRAALAGDLEALHASFEAALASCRLDSFVTAHGAYGYLADRYGLTQVALTGLSPEAEPSARDLASAVELMRDQGLQHVLREPVLSAGAVEAVASEVNATALDIHQIGSVTASELAEHTDYFGLMRDNLRSLSTALECAA